MTIYILQKHTNTPFFHIEEVECTAKEANKKSIEYFEKNGFACATHECENDKHRKIILRNLIFDRQMALGTYRTPASLFEESSDMCIRRSY